MCYINYFNSTLEKSHLNDSSATFMYYNNIEEIVCHPVESLHGNIV